MSDILARQRTIVGTTAEWAFNDLVLGDGEIAIERVDGGGVKAKVGNGVLPFSACPYLGSPGSPGPPEHSVQFNSAGEFGGSTNWIADPANAGFILGTDVQQNREEPFTLSFHTTSTAPVAARFYGRRNPVDPTAFDRAVIDYAQDPAGNFFSGIRLETDTELDGSILLQPCNGGSITTAVTTGLGPSGNSRGRFSVDLQLDRYEETAVAGGDYSALVGGWNNSILKEASSSNIHDGAWTSGVFCGYNNVIDPNPIGGGSTCVIIGGGNNIVYGDGCSIFGGGVGVIYGYISCIVGGINSELGTFDYGEIYSVMLGGVNCRLQGGDAVTLGGRELLVDSSFGVGMGWCAHTRTVPNAFAQGAGAAFWLPPPGGLLPEHLPGQLQTVSYVVQCVTLDGFQRIMTTDGMSYDGTNDNVLKVWHDSAYSFRANICCKRYGSTQAAAWLVTGLVVCGATPGTVALIGAPTITSIATSNPAWTVAVGVSTAWDGDVAALEFRVTGSGGTELWWCAHVQTTEVYTDKTVPPLDG